MNNIFTRNRTVFLMTVLSGLLLAGCGTTQIRSFVASANTTTSAKYQAIGNVESVKIFLSKKQMPSKYTVIGEAKISNYNADDSKRSQKDIFHCMRIVAAALGGQGVTDVTREEVFTTAKIIRYRNFSAKVNSGAAIDHIMLTSKK